MVPERVVRGVVTVGWLLVAGGCNCGGAPGGDAGTDAGVADAGAADAGVCPTGAGPGEWTWVSGSPQGDQLGVYGTRGTPAADNVPTPRASGSGWLGADGSLWLFGGLGSDGLLNDLWRFDGTNWTWMSGAAALVSMPGVYGTRGVADPANTPGARSGAVAWTDSSGNLWLFGGYGVGVAAGQSRPLNDLWKFDGTRWTWVKGSSAVDQPGVYGALGVAADTNVPGARTGAVGWTDSRGHFWLFGGNDMEQSASAQFADLWRFDGTNWTWMGGPAGAGGAGHFGDLGVADAGNAPPDLSGAVGWTGRGDALWLFGGSGYSCGDLVNELWRFDGANWAWMGGDCTGAAGTYGQQGVAAAGNVPGARTDAVTWTDRCGDGWLFGGADGFDGDFDDVWKFDGKAWTWVTGLQGGAGAGQYGTKGAPAAGDHPGGRSGSTAWIDSSGAAWIFGGWGYDEQGSYGPLNDLWRYRP
jgi:Galactose oxidase, central domain